LIRFASEYVGLTDPDLLPMTLAAFKAWQGPPELELALAGAAV